jgi:OmpA-OmpF porin, OOP family
MLERFLKYPLIASAVIAGFAHAQAPGRASGYVTFGAQQAVRSDHGACLRAGYWTQDAATEECDPQLVVKSAPKPEPVAEVVTPKPAPVAAKLDTPAPSRATWSTEVLFEFERAELAPEGRKLLDDLAQKLLAMDLESVAATAHADRIGGAAYNERLSARRAETIRSYLADKGLPEKLLHVESKGEREPVTGERCNEMGPENKQNAKLVACLQPDRRVEIEVAGRLKK